MIPLLNLFDSGSCDSWGCMSDVLRPHVCDIPELIIVGSLCGQEPAETGGLVKRIMPFSSSFAFLQSVLVIFPPALVTFLF